jgi:hypothetical protein
MVGTAISFLSRAQDVNWRHGQFQGSEMCYQYFSSLLILPNQRKRFTFSGFAVMTVQMTGRVFRI